VVFLGTPAFAVPALDALVSLAAAGEIELAGVVTQPDRPGHRGRIARSAVAQHAEERGLTVLRLSRLRGADLDAVRALRPEALVWAAYGNLIPAELLDAVKGRAMNVHASLLPRWRGAAPIAHAILAGDQETGITLMEGTAELDAGAILATGRIPVLADDDAGSLTARLAARGGELLRDRLGAYLAGRLTPRPQDAAAVTWAPKLTTAELTPASFATSARGDGAPRLPRHVTGATGCHLSSTSSSKPESTPIDNFCPRTYRNLGSRPERT